LLNAGNSRRLGRSSAELGELPQPAHPGSQRQHPISPVQRFSRNTLQSVQQNPPDPIH
jgi:hypothetical protein